MSAFIRPIQVSSVSLSFHSFLWEFSVHRPSLSLSIRLLALLGSEKIHIQSREFYSSPTAAALTDRKSFFTWPKSLLKRERLKQRAHSRHWLVYGNEVINCLLTLRLLSWRLEGLCLSGQQGEGEPKLGGVKLAALRNATIKGET